MCHTSNVYIYCPNRCEQFTREDGLVVGDETTEFCRQLWNERLCADNYVRDFWIEQNNSKKVCKIDLRLRGIVEIGKPCCLQL